ncbi:cell division protein SepF [Collinsella tanakaei]|uniref:cell division protein SepF n=1 Tax=Collinsella tanakaei TaxID=626935 RepID=UPI0019560CDB|nr:cell division protein SepF [Collinsella tanakaei]MBM6868021.1 cell division protein SepF [Collinsella tanakaei]
MSFLDEIKSRLSAHTGQGGYGAGSYGDEEGYGDGYYDEDEGGYDDRSYDSSDYGYDNRETSHGVLGQTHRGEAESVAVYTRSGQLVGDADRHATTFNPPARSTDAAAYRPGAYDTPSSYAEARRQTPAHAAPAAPSATAAHINEVVNGTPQLPAYVLRPESYDDVETVVRRVRTRQPVALVFVGVRTEIAKRVLDFSYGFACGLGATVRELGDRVFIVLPQGCEVKDSDVAKLRADGYLK